MSELKGAKMEGSKVPAEEISFDYAVVSSVFSFCFCTDVWFCITDIGASIA